MKWIALAAGVVTVFALATVLIISSGIFRGNSGNPATHPATDPQASLPLPGKELCTTPGLSIRRVVSEDPHDGHGIISSEEGIKTKNLPLLALAVHVYNEYTCRMDLLVPLPDGRSDVVLSRAKDLDSASGILQALAPSRSNSLWLVLSRVWMMAWSTGFAQTSGAV